MIRMFLTLYVGLLIILIAAGMTVSGIGGFSPKLIQSVDSVQKSATGRNYVSDPRESEAVIELEGPLMRNIFEDYEQTHRADGPATPPATN